MSQLCPIGKLLHVAVIAGASGDSIATCEHLPMGKSWHLRVGRPAAWALVLLIGGLAGPFTPAAPAVAQDQADKPSRDDQTEQAQEKQAQEKSSEPVYPRGVSVDGDRLFVVDSDLPGVWKTSADGSSPELFVRGSKFFRKPLNRPFSAIVHPEGGVLIGDAATREVYRVAKMGGEPEALTDGQIGIPMALAVDPQNQTIYVGDAETRSIMRLPLAGGDPELVVRVNARGLAFDDQGQLYAVTPDDAAIQRVDVEAKTAEPIVTGRPYAYPNGIAWAGDHGYVSDGYGKKVWKFTPDGETETWFEGEPLVGPVGIAATEQSVLVADPKTQQVYEIKRESQEVTERL